MMRNVFKRFEKSSSGIEIGNTSNSNATGGNQPAQQVTSPIPNKSLSKGNKSGTLNVQPVSTPLYCLLKSLDLYSTGYHPVENATEPADKVDATNEVTTNIAWRWQQSESWEFNTKLNADAG